MVTLPRSRPCPCWPTARERPTRANPVQWVRTLQNMAADGVDTFIEVGPGKTLTGLVSRTLEGVTALPCETVGQLEAVLAELAEKGE